MKNLITNAFSLNMLFLLNSTIHVIELDDAHCQRLLENWQWESVVGHADTAAVFSSILGREVACNRATVSLEVGDMLLVGQYKGPRLEEGTKTLPEGASIVWALVSIDNPQAKQPSTDWDEIEAGIYKEVMDLEDLEMAERGLTS